MKDINTVASSSGFKMPMQTYLVKLALVLVAFACQSVKAETTASQYSRDVIAVYMATEDLADIVTLCADTFPNTLSTNKAAYQNWRFQHLPFLHGMEQSYATLTRDMAGQDTPRQLEVIRQVDQQLNITKEKSRKQLKSLDEDRFRGICNGYPLYLTTERVNFEQKYAKEINSIKAFEQERHGKELEFQAISCAETEKQAQTFAKDQLPQILIAARENQSHPGPGHIALLTIVGMLKDQVASCRQIDGTALGTKIPLANYFEKYFELFSQSYLFMSQWELKLPSEISDSKNILNRLQELQHSLTEKAS
jgi:hypothetical protein